MWITSVRLYKIKATEGFSIYGSQLQELKPKVAQIPLFVRISLGQLLSMDQHDLVLGGFLFPSLSIALQTSDFWATCRLFSTFLLFLDFRTFCLWIFYTLFTLVLLRHQGGVVGGFSLLCLPFLLLRQKIGVFFFFGPRMYF